MATKFYVATFSLPEQYELQTFTCQYNIRHFNEGLYKFSERSADFALICDDGHGNMDHTFVLEVRYLESYEYWVELARLWLEGAKTVSVCCLIVVHEDPVYQSPLRHIPNDQLKQLQLPWGLREHHFAVVPGSHGPATAYGFNWTGQIKSARMEI